MDGALYARSPAITNCPEMSPETPKLRLEPKWGVAEWGTLSCEGVYVRVPIRGWGREGVHFSSRTLRGRKVPLDERGEGGWGMREKEELKEGL